MIYARAQSCYRSIFGAYANLEPSILRPTGSGGGGGGGGIDLFVMKPLNEHWSQMYTYDHWIATNYTMHVWGQFLIYQLHMNGMKNTLK